MNLLAVLSQYICNVGAVLAVSAFC